MNINNYKTNLKRRLERLTERKDKLEKEHKGNEQNYTYHGGFDLGYLKGKISEIEDTIDEVEDLSEETILDVESTKPINPVWVELFGIVFNETLLILNGLTPIHEEHPIPTSEEIFWVNGSLIKKLSSNVEIPLEESYEYRTKLYVLGSKINSRELKTILK